MTDRELLELAAKAAEVTGGWGDLIKYGNGEVDLSDTWILEGEEFAPWDPLNDDGDAFRLALKLQIKIEYWPENDSVLCTLPGGMGATSVAAIGDVELRYAIVQAAAQKGLTV